MELSKEHCLNIRGIAILIIAIHNYVDHLLRIHCNEMFYSNSATKVFLENFFSENGVWYLLSFAGWIAVSLFIFLSGYGLTKKYGSPCTDGFNQINYLKCHVIKIWKLFIPIYLLFIITLTFLFDHPFHGRVVLTTVTFLVNLLSYGNNNYPIFPGVYWFVGVIVQFYIVFIALSHLNTKQLCLLCLAFLAIHYFALYFTSEDTMIWIRHNFLGWGAPFVFGMITARESFDILNSLRVKLAICVVSLLILACCITNKFLSPFTELFTVLFFITLITSIRSSKVLSFLGLISPCVFVVHPYVRLLFFNYFSSPSHPFTMVIVYLIPVILLSWVYYLIIKEKEHN